jgi:hypothetical protein
MTQGFGGPPRHSRPPNEETPPQGVTSAPKKAVTGTHRHFWTDVTTVEREYTEQTCNGERWSPGEHVMPTGCGARRRILKTIYSPLALSSRCPPDDAWEFLDPGRS